MGALQREAAFLRPGAAPPRGAAAARLFPEQERRPMPMKKPPRSRAQRVAPFAACAVVAAGLGLASHFSPDPLWDYAWLPIVDQRTEWAAGYSRAGFAAIQPGASWAD